MSVEIIQHLSAHLGPSATYEYRSAYVIQAVCTQGCWPWLWLIYLQSIGLVT
jgi:hypothetical protein